MLDPAITDSELVKLKNGGFTGFRIKANGRGGLSFEEAKRMAERTAGFGWHVEFMCQSTAEAISAVPVLNSLRQPYVFDHVAHAEPHAEAQGKFGELLAILKNEEHAWINLYSFYQLSDAGPPEYADMIEIVQRIIEARADRVIWGSNWPHAGIAVPMPNDSDLLDFLLAATPAEQSRQQILADNPAALYGWK